jgi:hypothetical protein
MQPITSLSSISLSVLSIFILRIKDTFYRQLKLAFLTLLCCFGRSLFCFGTGGVLVSQLKKDTLFWLWQRR